ncbi:MAG: hypothetical protein D8H95_11950 [Lachnospiraceae bacterium]|nr:MAG: hypothetical protein D8H95_11950 [Lachnospiraceae bacterium]
MAFRRFLDTVGVIQSFLKKGYPFDNTFCESFFNYLKKESVTAEPTKTRIS